MRRHILFLVFAAAVIFCGDVRAEDRSSSSLPPEGELLGTVFMPSNNANLDRKTRKELDRLVPELTGRGEKKVIRIEGICLRGATRDKRIANSLCLAKNVENYLRTRHNLKLDLYIAAGEKEGESEGRDFVRILLYPPVFDEVHVSTIGGMR